MRVFHRVYCKGGLTSHLLLQVFNMILFWEIWEPWRRWIKEEALIKSKTLLLMSGTQRLWLFIRKTSHTDGLNETKHPSKTTYSPVWHLFWAFTQTKFSVQGHRAVRHWIGTHVSSATKQNRTECQRAPNVKLCCPFQFSLLTHFKWCPRLEYNKTQDIQSTGHCI
jgi:hypothetical protein